MYQIPFKFGEILDEIYNQGLNSVDQCDSNEQAKCYITIII